MSDLDALVASGAEMVITCRPVDLAPLERRVGMGVEIPDAYPESTQDDCGECEAKVLVGPNQTMLRMELEHRNRPYRLLCWLCMLETTAASSRTAIARSDELMNRPYGS